MVESCQFIRPVYFNLTLLNLKLLFWQHQSFINKCRDIDCWNKIAFDRNIFRKLISERQTCVLDYGVEKNFIYFKIEMENFANCEFNEFWRYLLHTFILSAGTNVGQYDALGRCLSRAGKFYFLYNWVCINFLESTPLLFWSQ